tara:strand:- start:10 stop:249 length:240 start_codon:yes stop_codon:yes gene_type:complete
MFVKTYKDLSSSAIFWIDCDENVINVTYQSNRTKSYAFDCENVSEFIKKLDKTIEKAESVGKLVNSEIKAGKLVPNDYA